MKGWLFQTHSTFQCLYEEIMYDKYQITHFMILSVTIHQFEKYSLFSSILLRGGWVVVSDIQARIQDFKLGGRT